MILKISGGIVISEGAIHKNASVYIKDHKIMAVSEQPLPFDDEMKADGLYVSAGFIDIHVHGGGGYDFSDGGMQPILGAANFHARHGTTTLLPTLTAENFSQTEQFLHDVQSAMLDKSTDVTIYGAHLEGPYLSKHQCGALNKNNLKPPVVSEYQSLAEKYPNVIKRWTFAPELPGSLEFFQYIKRSNIVGSMGHSDAFFEDVKKLNGEGCNLVTHLYSAMSSITRHRGFRKLGLVESALLLDDIYVEIIADLRHLPQELIQLIYKIKGKDSICLITDAMRGAGMPDGPSLLGNRRNGTPCLIKDGVAKLMDESAFAGSVATADRLVRGCVKTVGMDLVTAIQMMTINPARFMGMKHKGDLKTGMDADILIFDNNIQIQRVIAMGKTVFHAV